MRLRAGIGVGRRIGRQHPRHQGVERDAFAGRGYVHAFRDGGWRRGWQGWRRAGIRFSSAESRSEEHTSELQSLMRISYAVFCLKKKNHESIFHTPTAILT